MYPPRVSTRDVQSVIRELTHEGQLPAGAAVRRVLEARFGSRGGVARIYRLLAEEARRFTPVAPPGSLEALQHEVQSLRAQLARTQEYEDAQQSHWAMEVDRLRMQVKALEPLANLGRKIGEGHELLRYRLQAAEQRSAVLEERLLAALKVSGSTVVDPRR